LISKILLDQIKSTGSLAILKPSRSAADCHVFFLFILFMEDELNGRFILFQNTYTNADKLLAAAEELAHTGECDPDEIYSVAHELEAHVTSFATRVEQRRRRLDLAVLFYTHEKELGNWVDDLRQELQSDESIAESLEATERLLEQTAQHRDQSLDACASTIAQGEALLQELR
jgi:hypothetical protein